MRIVSVEYVAPLDQEALGTLYVKAKVDPSECPHAVRQILQIADDRRPTADEILQARVSKIHAIKAYRARTGASLKDAKDAIDAVA